MFRKLLSKNVKGRLYRGRGKGTGRRQEVASVLILSLYYFLLYTFPAYISDALHDLVPFVQFKKHEKHPWRNDTFSKLAG